MINVVVTGGRDYLESSKVFTILSSFNINHLYVGDAIGADQAAREWAGYHGISMTVFNADWAKYGKSAGPIRNGEMLDAAGNDAIVVAFLGGHGTKNCVNQAHERGMIVLRVEE